MLDDLDLLAPMARRGLATVYLSMTVLDNRLTSKLEPRATPPHARLKTNRALSEAGLPTGVLVAPVAPMITGKHLEAILEATHDAGTRAAGYALLRLPHELREIWREWPELHHPERAQHVMSLIRQMRCGRDYDSRFGTQIRGEDPFAGRVATRFAKAHRRLGYARLPPLDTTRFVPPRRPSPQGELL